MTVVVKIKISHLYFIRTVTVYNSFFSITVVLWIKVWLTGKIFGFEVVPNF